MPHVKSVKPLTEICINFFLENQEFICERFPIGELKDGVDVSLDTDKIGTHPFDELPNELLQELMRLLRDKESSLVRNRNKYPSIGSTYKITPFLKLLVTPCLRTLDLDLIENGSYISDVLRLAAIKSPHLEMLRLDPTSHQYVRSYSFIAKFTKLRLLTISNKDTADDDFFDLIGTHCPDLRELSLSPGNDFKVTDLGIRRLCVDGNCKSIRLLDLGGRSKVTTKGIQLALDNLPQLRILKHKCLLECLADIVQTAKDNTLPKYSLSKIKIFRDFCVKQTNLPPQFFLLCPNVTHVIFDMWERERFEDDDLLSLLSLDKLHTISITNVACLSVMVSQKNIRIDRELTFPKVVSLFNKFGHCLKSLEFSGIFVDISAIIKFCPKLESLNLWHTNCTTNQSTATKLKSPIILHNLKKLTIRNNVTISSENLWALLSSPLLSYLSIWDSLTDDILQRAMSLHSFRNLESLIVARCQSVTKKGIDLFMQESNPIRLIKLNITDAITREDINDWNDNAIWIRKNWNLNFYICNKGWTYVSIGGNRNFWEIFK